MADSVAAMSASAAVLCETTILVSPTPARLKKVRLWSVCLRGRRLLVYVYDMTHVI